MTTTHRLIASAPTVDGIANQINKFYASTRYAVDPETLAITHPDGSVPSRVRVVRKGRRYRFEMEVTG